MLTLLPDYRQIAPRKLSHLFALTNSKWEEPLLIRPGQAGLVTGRYSIMKVFTLVISQGCNILFYGLDCASRWEWDVFNVRAERILFVNALMSVMKQCNLKSKVDDKETLSLTRCRGQRILTGDLLKPAEAPQPGRRREGWWDFTLRKLWDRMSWAQTRPPTGSAVNVLQEQ